MAYCTYDDVRALTGLTSSQVSDATLTTLISYATAQLNQDIQVHWNDELVNYISNEKENDIDASNRKYFVQHYPIGDRDDNGTISGADVYCYAVSSVDGSRRQIIVSGIYVDGTEPGSKLGGPLWLSTDVNAPQNNETLYFSYVSSPVDMETPHPLVKLACTQLAASLAFTNVDARKVQSFRVGKVAVMKQSQAYSVYRMQYEMTLNRIRQELFKVAQGDLLL